VPSPKQPPSRDDFVRTIEVTTDAFYFDRIFDNETAPVNETAQIYRGNARHLAELANVMSRGATRQFFHVPPGFEPAGPAVRATMVMTLERTQDLDEHLILVSGRITAEGPRGRVYRSMADEEWFGDDPDEAPRAVELTCELIGEAGNLDYLADADGNLTIPGVDPTEPDTAIVDLQDLSQMRSGIRGVLTVAAGEVSTLTDDGAAPTFSPSDVGLYLRINFAGNANNIGRVLRIIDYEQSTVADPMSTNMFPRTVTLEDGAVPQLIGAAQLDDGGLFTVLTTEARSETADDVPLLPAVPAVGDAFYFGASERFDFLDVVVTTALAGTLELTWEYWDGATWQTMPDLIDDTNSFQKVGRRSVSWSTPGAWASVVVNGLDFFWLRSRVSSFTSQAQQPLAGRCIVGIADPLLPDPLDPQGNGQVSWTILDATDLGLSITEMTAPAGGRDDDLGLKIAERGVVRRVGESDEALRIRASRFANVVSPTLLEREVNQILQPFGLAGQIVDPGDGFLGLFWDTPISFAPDLVGAWDLYGPGDLFPTDLTMLPLSDLEAKWNFFVCVPPPTLGEFGTAWDEGPPSVYVDTYAEFLGQAWDYAFLDGYPWLSAALYKSVYERVKAAKGGGIRFTLIQCDVPTCP
jgi:hypothetical protein